MADVTLVFDAVIVDRYFRKIAVGQAVTLLAQVKDISSSPGQRVNFDPVSIPQVAIHNPDGSIKVDFAQCNFVNTGLYNYQHQTLLSDQLGMYTACFRLLNNSKSAVTAERIVFEVTPA